MKSKSSVIATLFVSVVLVASCSAGEDKSANAGAEVPAIAEKPAGEEGATMGSEEEPGSASAPVIDQGPVVAEGEWISFTKADGADPNDPANQDRISDDVILARGNQGGQIYNAVSESRADARTSPAGTLWALGTTAELDSLEFQPFRAAVGKPKNIAGKDLVLYLVESETYIDIRFTSWSAAKQGGFAYERRSLE